MLIFAGGIRKGSIMILGMTESELKAFLDRISATSIANQAILKCYVHDVPLTADNIRRFAVDTVDVTKTDSTSFIARIEVAIEEVVGKPSGESSPLN